MSKRSKYETLIIITNNHALLWKESRGIAPDSVASKLDDAMLEWQSELTKTLKIWIDKGLEMTTGGTHTCQSKFGSGGRIVA